MRNYLLLARLGIALPVFGQISFLDSTIYLDNVGLLSGTPMAAADMNGDGLQDLIILDNRQELYIEYQQDNTPFFNSFYVQSLNNPSNGIAVGDVDGNGYNDILTGGAYNALRLFLANDDGTDYTAIVIDPGNYFLQGTNMADIDNDGDLDLFAAHQDGLSAPFRNLGNNVFSLDYNLINPVSSVPSDNSGNYGTVWADYNNDGASDLYISKYRLGVTDATDGRRLNLLFRNDDDDDFTEVAAFAGLLPMGQSISTAFGDIDNDGDYDAFVINHDIPNALYRNNGNGTFTNITSNSNIPEALAGTGLGVQAIFTDFDNDGRLDLLYTSIGANHAILRNQGNSTFVRVNNAIPAPGRIHSAVVGDFNADGFVDIYAGYGLGFNQIGTQPDKLLINAGNNNHYVEVALKGTDANPNGVGSRVEIYGPWGRQVREIRSGEGYGIHCGLRAHFGLGPSTTLDSIIVRWPNGNIDHLEDPDVDTLYQITEGEFCQAQADFSLQVTGLTASFQGTGDTGTNQYFWDFSDGAQDTGATVVHTFPITGTFTACLTTVGDCGSATVCKQLQTSCTPPEVFFAQNNNGLEVSFQDFSFGMPNEWIWDFGDGNSSGEQNPTHSYSQPGNYFVCLVVLNNCGNASTCELVQVNCGSVEADFDFADDDLNVAFTDSSSAGTNSWSWDFGDGNTSDSQNPQHAYDAPGTYQVCLSVDGACGTDITCRDVAVTCPPPAAAFTTEITELAVFVEDQSANFPDSWSWDFGDGTTANGPALFHNYDAPGIYEICLSIENICGNSAVCDTIAVSCPPPQAGFTYESDNLLVSFQDNSNGGTAQWAWVIDGQDTLTGPSPEYLFPGSGSYEVCLIASSVCGSDVVCETIELDCSNAPLGFSIDLDGLEATFTDTSFVQANSWFWQVNGQGVGGGSSFSFTFPSTGVFEICLQSNGPCGLLSTCTAIEIACLPPNAAFASSANGLSYTFTANLPGTATVWSWDFGDGNSAMQANAMHTYSSPGTYEICLTATNECGVSNTACQTESVGCPAPNAAFEQVSNLLSVSFFDASSNNPAQWGWDFGDGNTSTQQNPSHTYGSAGTYEVCLTTSSICGSDEFCAPVIIDCPEPQASFEVQVDELTVALTDLSPNTPTEWDWDFGDGGSSGIPNPTHTFNAPGTYTICLITSNTCGSNQSCQQIAVSCAAPAPAFTTTADELQVNFQDNTTNAPTSWSWTFGDGNGSAQQNPSHSYAAPGTYEVCLTAESICGSNTACSQVTISCNAPQPVFTVQEEELSVSFTDASTNSPTSWFWTFGDGNSATGPNPMHTYSQPGTYTVCLEAGSLCGSATDCETVQVSCAAPQAQFSFQPDELNVAFADASTASPASWAWDFGDGTGSTLPNPVHAYAAPGTYTVCLTVSSVCGTTESCQNITVSCAAPEAGFEYTPNQLNLTFADASAHNPTSWSWNFGDGTTSDLENPTHTFPEPGIYTVCLSVSSICGTSQTCQTIGVTCNAPQSNFTYMNSELAVDFTDISTNTPGNWFWTFGDGNSSTAQNPTHTFSSPGNYLVCLQASSVCGSTQRCELITVTCTPPQAGFGFAADELLATFQDSSTTDAVAWLWTFGDGQSSTQQAPMHTYSQPGAYQVCLTASNICGSTQLCDSITVTCSPPWVNYNWIGEDGTVSFFELADNTVTEWSWDFGDGNTSGTPNPIHTYEQSGLYPVCLTAADLCGSSTYCDTIEVVIVGTATPESAPVRLFPNPANDVAWLIAPGLTEGQAVLYTMQGQEAGRWALTGSELRIPLTPYPAGTYLLRLEAANYFWQERLLKLR
jgi:PKD repeat protein